MTFLPIQFSKKYKKEEFGELHPSEILDLIQNYLNKQGFLYVKRKKDKIIFHIINPKSYRFKGILVSGIIKVKKKVVI